MVPPRGNVWNGPAVGSNPNPDGPLLGRAGHRGGRTEVDRVARQGLKLAYCSAQLEYFVWDRGCAWGSCIPY